MNKENSLIEIQRDYFLKIFASISGMKIILLDDNTSQIISLNFMQSEAFEYEIFLFDNISNLKQEKIQFLNAIYFITDPNNHM